MNLVLSPVSVRRPPHDLYYRYGAHLICLKLSEEQKSSQMNSTFWTCNPSTNSPSLDLYLSLVGMEDIAQGMNRRFEAPFTDWFHFLDKPHHNFQHFFLLIYIVKITIIYTLELLRCAFCNLEKLADLKRMIILFGARKKHASDLNVAQFCAKF